VCWSALACGSKSNRSCGEPRPLQPHARSGDESGPRAAARRAPARGLRLGDVRLCQFGLHHGGHHGHLRRLLRSRHCRWCHLGHAGLDGGLGLFQSAGAAQRPRARGLGRRARRQKATGGADHRRLRAHHGGAGLGRAGQRAAGAGAAGAVECVFQRRRQSGGGLFARARAPAAPGHPVGLGLGLGLHRRLAVPGAVLGLHHLGAGAWPHRL